MAKKQIFKQTEALAEEIRSEIIEKTSEIVSELKEIEAKIARAEGIIAEHRQMEKDINSEISDLHGQNIDGKGGMDNLDKISSHVVKIQAITQIVSGVEQRIKDLHIEKSKKLDEVCKAYGAAFNQIRDRIHLEIDQETEKLVKLLETVEPALSKGLDPWTFIPGLESYGIAGLRPQFPGRLIHLFSELDAWVDYRSREGKY